MTDNLKYQSGTMPFQDIAESAYMAYAASTGNKNFRGEPMPEWGALPRPIQIAWEAAVRQAIGLHINPQEPRNEHCWTGWTPPGE